MIAPPTPREAEVLAAALEGGTDKEIGSALNLSFNTVEHHLWELRRREGVHTTRRLLCRVWARRCAAVAAELAERTAQLDHCRRALAGVDQRRGTGP